MQSLSSSSLISPLSDTSNYSLVADNLNGRLSLSANTTMKNRDSQISVQSASCNSLNNNMNGRDSQQSVTGGKMPLRRNDSGIHDIQFKRQFSGPGIGSVSQGGRLSLSENDNLNSSHILNLSFPQLPSNNSNGNPCDQSSLSIGDINDNNDGTNSNCQDTNTDSQNNNFNLDLYQQRDSNISILSESQTSNIPITPGGNNCEARSPTDSICCNSISNLHLNLTTIQEGESDNEEEGSELRCQRRSKYQDSDLANDNDHDHDKLDDFKEGLRRVTELQQLTSKGTQAVSPTTDQDLTGCDSLNKSLDNITDVTVPNLNLSNIDININNCMNHCQNNSNYNSNYKSSMSQYQSSNQESRRSVSSDVDMQSSCRHSIGTNQTGTGTGISSLSNVGFIKSSSSYNNSRLSLGSDIDMTGTTGSGPSGQTVGPTPNQNNQNQNNNQNNQQQQNLNSIVEGEEPENSDEKKHNNARGFRKENENHHNARDGNMNESESYQQPITISVSDDLNHSKQYEIKTPTTQTNPGSSNNLQGPASGGARNQNSLKKKTSSMKKSSKKSKQQQSAQAQTQQVQKKLVADEVMPSRIIDVSHVKASSKSVQSLLLQQASKQSSESTKQSSSSSKKSRSHHHGASGKHSSGNSSSHMNNGSTETGTKLSKNSHSSASSSTNSGTKSSTTGTSNSSKQTHNNNNNTVSNTNSIIQKFKFGIPPRSPVQGPIPYFERYPSIGDSRIASTRAFAFGPGPTTVNNVNQVIQAQYSANNTNNTSSTKSTSSTCWALMNLRNRDSRLETLTRNLKKRKRDMDVNDVLKSLNGEIEDDDDEEEDEDDLDDWEEIEYSARKRKKVR